MTNKEWLNEQISAVRKQIEVERIAVAANPSSRERQFFLRARQNLLADLEQKLKKLS